jgi:hypothetical protein
MKIESWQGLRNFLLALFVAVSFTAFAQPVAAQNPEMQQKVSDVKQVVAMNKQALAQYTWVEQDTISLKGEQKKQEHFQVRMGPDGKPQKTSLDPAQSADSGHEGRLKKHIIEKKKEEYEEYGDQIKALIHQYVPPDKDMIQQAYQQGNIMMGPEGAPGEFRLVISNYIKQGDKMTLVVDKAQMGLLSVSIATYLNDPSDAVNVSVQFGRIPGGPNHVSAETIDGVSKKVTIVVQNSNYQHL